MPRDFYPPLEPYATRSVAVGEGHTLYLEECGNPQGVPVLFVHGGPGGGCSPDNRRFFDPARYRIILFDQRGCGRSQPHAELTHNTTQHLVADMERIRALLGIERWLVFGGSWGSTLALVYAETHPGCVLGLVLRGIFLGTDTELHWFYQDGVRNLFPDYFAEFLAPIPTAEQGDVLQAYYRRLTGDDPELRRQVAQVWSLFEARCSTLLPSEALLSHATEPDVALAMARLECHYFVNRCFLVPGQILQEVHRLRGIPAIIVQGRYDVVCPALAAWRLKQAWPEAELQLIADAGHASTEPGIKSALIEATDVFARQLGA